MMWRTLQFFGVMAGGVLRSRGARVAMLGGLFSVCVLASLLGVYKAGLWAYAEANTTIVQTLDMRIKDVAVSGADHIDVTEILERHGLSVGALQAGIDWHGARTDLSRNPMLMGARIAWVAPEKIKITLVPRKPIARIDHQGKSGETILVDHAGHKIRVIGQISDKNLITLSGKGAFQNVDEFWPLLTANPVLFSQVHAARFVGNRRWDMVLKSGALIQLPQSDTALALTHLNALMSSQTLDLNVARTIDMRAGDRLFLRLKPTEVTSDVQTPRQG